MLSRQMRIGVWLTALLTALVGGVNLWSAVTPSLPGRVAWLEQFYPIEVRTSAHLFSALTGFFLLTLATNLLRRKRVAWWFTVGLLAISIITHLVKGLDYEEGILSLILLVQLLVLRKAFTAQSDRPSIIQGIWVLVGALLFTLAYGILGFFLLDQHYARPFHLLDAIAQTLTLAVMGEGSGLLPTTRFGRFFADSISTVAVVTVVYALALLFRPVIFRGSAPEEERQRAKTIVERYGQSSLTRLTLLPDKSYFFSPSGESVIAYVPKGRGAIVLGDPIGPEADRREAIAAFQVFCDCNDWHPAFYQTLPDDLELYHSLGFHTVKIGEEAVIDLHTFTLEGKAGRSLRTPYNKFTKQGYRVQFYQPPIADSLLQDLRAVSDDWLAQVQGAEKKFSLGWFDDEYLGDCEIAVVEDPQGTAIAFANVIPEYQINEISVDLMRHLSTIEPGTMDFLFISLFQHFKQRGFTGFNFGLVALAGVGDAPQSSRLERGLHYLYAHLNQFYNFQGLRAYKDKFRPHWEPRYFVYSRLADLPDTVVALVRADSGDRLLDYLGAEFFSTALTNGLKWISHLLPALISVTLFGLSTWAIVSELHKYQPQDILSSIATISPWALGVAIALTAVNYIFLTGYDALAIRYINHPLPYRKTALVAIISYAVSNSVGLALLSGSAIRYRFYATWGLSPGKIAQIVAFCNLSFWIGLFAVGGLVFTTGSLELPDLLHLPFDTVHPIGIFFLTVIAVYLIGSSLSRKPIKIRDWVIPHLPIQLSLAQIVITACDWALAAAVLYVLLPPQTTFSYGAFLGIYLLAQIAGIISNVPGGLGVFETVLILLLSPPLASSSLLGALVVYRIIYYFLPLISGVALLVLYEVRQGVKRPRFLSRRLNRRIGLRSRLAPPSEAEEAVQAPPSEETTGL